MLYPLDFVRELTKSIASSLKRLVDTSIEYKNLASAYIVDLLRA
jgi:hypothetical protein